MVQEKLQQSMIYENITITLQQLCAPLDWQYAEYCPSQLAMQSCALCLYVECVWENKLKFKIFIFAEKMYNKDEILDKN